MSGSVNGETTATTSRLGLDGIAFLEVPRYIFRRNLGHVPRRLPYPTDENLTTRHEKDGEALSLSKAAALGKIETLVAAGLEGLAEADDDAKTWAHECLEHAARLGNQLAMLMLGLELRSTEPRAAKYWLTRGGVLREADETRLGIFLYLATHGRPASVCSVLLQRAADCLLNRFKCDDWEAGAMLGYIIRRKENDPERMPSIDVLLQHSLDRRDSFAEMNRILLLLENTLTHDEAIAQLKRLRGTWGILEWWTARAREGDPEGHLVLALLVMQGLSLDPDNMAPLARINGAGNTKLVPRELIASQRI
jgi:hypothetical protein